MDRVDFVPRGWSSSHGYQSVPLLSEGLLNEGGKPNTIKRYLKEGMGVSASITPEGMGVSA